MRPAAAAYYEQGYNLRTTWTSAKALAAIGASGRERAWIFKDQMFPTLPALELPYQKRGHWSSDALELLLYQLGSGS